MVFFFGIIGFILFFCGIANMMKGADMISAAPQPKSKMVWGPGVQKF